MSNCTASTEAPGRPSGAVRGALVGPARYLRRQGLGVVAGLPVVIIAMVVYFRTAATCS